MPTPNGLLFDDFHSQFVIRQTINDRRLRRRKLSAGKKHETVGFADD